MEKHSEKTLTQVIMYTLQIQYFFFQVLILNVVCATMTKLN
jgi:hypothetical protein